MSKLSQERNPERTPVSVLPSRQTGRTGPSGKRRTWIAVAAVAVVAAFAVAMLWPSLGSAGRSESIDADTYAQEAVAGMEANFTYDELAAIARAEASMAKAEEEARATLAAAVAEAQAEVDALMTLPKGVPAAPSGYAGGDVSLWVPAPADPEPFALPALPGHLTAEEFSALEWRYVPSPVSEKESRFAQLDDLLDQLSILQDQLDALGSATDSGETDLLWSTLEGQGLPSGRDQGVDGVGSDDVPEEAPDDPEGTVEPDGEGAQLAAAHAGQVLSVATGELTTFQQDLERIEELHATLVATVDHVMAVTPALQNETTLRLADELIQRLGALDAQLEAVRTQVEMDLAAYKAWVTRSAPDVGSELPAIAEAQAAAVLSAGEEQATSLTAEAERVRTEADKAVAAVEAQTQDAVKTLLALQKESDADLSEQLAMVRTTGASVVAEIEAAAAFKIANLQTAAAAIRADAQAAAAQIEAVANETGRHIDHMVDQGLERARLSADFALKRAEYVHGLETEMVTQLHQDTLESFLVESERNVEATLDAAWDINQASKDVLAGTDTLVLSIEEDVLELVGSDVEYIGKVIEDYRQVPTPEREAAAAQLEQLTGLIDNDLEGVVAGTDQAGAVVDLVVRIGEVSAVVAEAEGELEARGAGL